jgi:hypothetical protein
LDKNMAFNVYVKNAAKSKNPNYLVRIESTSGLSLVVDMPEQFALSFASTFEPRFPAAASNYAPGLDTLSRLAGESILVQEFTSQMWMDTAPIEVPVELLFDAQNSAYEDVYVPMKTLEALSLPDVYGSLLTSPAPSYANPNRNRISLFIGRAWYFPSVLLTSVNSTYDMRLDADGYPISGNMSCVFSTGKVFGKQDWFATASTPRF